MTDAPAAKPDRTLIIILSVIGALVVIALVVVFTRGEPELLDESTPEGVVQRYAAAVIDGDEAAAIDYLVPELADDCERFDTGPVQDLRVTLVSTTERDDTADVEVLIVTTYEGGLFGSSQYEEQAVFDLVRADGTWLIESAPWQFTVCTPTSVKG
ncbi:hypothetical protein [Agromyces bauzanensis]|uniref:Lipoprotein LpqB N-terminal domain-containing protein n=1 Tax=Agromyces bauzanensis TaxID=1308924 RepID=A0A917US31_9MICO|nr:hypothetical protein [Agromyces bauzanensis]GGJ81319.1 hypothetical protein GCM10011372_19650 [Agromyces bauzanensis]